MRLRIFRLTEIRGEYSYIVQAWTDIEAVNSLKEKRLRNLVGDGDFVLAQVRQIIDQEYSVEDVTDEPIIYLNRE